ncbi:MAG: type II CAAX endopeptidase family protein [Candidatus Micrarchaeota archaeon]
MRPLLLFVAALSILSYLIVVSCGLVPGTICSFITDNALYIGSAAIHLALLSLAIFFLWKTDLRSMLGSLGFPGEPKKVILFTILCLAGIFAVLFVLTMGALYLGVNDQGKVVDKINGLPFYVLAFAAFGAPITEELFFRGFLTSRFGVIGSSLLFGAMHLAYGSVVELAGAFLLGIVLALTFRLSKSITPCILAHMAYNTLAITVMLVFA